MSGAFAGLSSLAGMGGQALSSLGLIPAFIRQPRSIGTIIPDVTIEEHFNDRAVVTQHPLAKNTPVSDHMYMLPREVTMRCGWTNANPVGGLVEGAMTAIGGDITGGISQAFGSLTESRAATIYNKLLKLQSDRQPFTLTCGKRTYGSKSGSSGSGILGSLQGAVAAVNSFLGPSGAIPAGPVVITELSVTNDHRTEYGLIIEVRMQEVMIIDLGNVGQPAQGDQAMPQMTQPVTDNGTQQAQPADVSTAQKLLGGPGFNKPNP